MARQDNIIKESMLRTGALLHGTYRIDDYLSSGGFGNTYVATHVNFNEKYAIKEFFMKGVSERDANNTTVSVSNSEKVDEFKEQLEKFKKEARRLRKLNNPHIVKVHDLFEENGTAYYVMDYINGENLKERLARTHKPMKESEVKDVLTQVLDALREVHDQGIWHLDLKPANVMVDRDGVVKLIDFGASKQFNNKTGGALSTSAVTFTNGYAPIEQMEKSYEKFGPWTDFYALGATLYNLLSNQRPPMPSDINDDTTLDKHLALPLPGGISKHMHDLLLWLMRPNRLERPSSVKDIVDFINSPSAKASVSADTDDVTVIDHPVEKPQPQPLDQGVEITRHKKSYKGLIIGALSALVIAIGFFLLLGKHGNGIPNKAIPECPTPPQLVNDFAGVLGGNTWLEDSLERISMESDIQFCVVTMNDLGGYDIDKMASGIGNKWGVGNKDNRGVVLLIKPKTAEGKGEMFISPGTGLEKVISNSICKQICNQEVIPYFKNNDYLNGIWSGIKVLRNIIDNRNASLSQSEGQVKMVSGVKVTIPLGECTYTGEVNADGVPDGHGTAVFSNGDKCEGTFVNGDITGDDITYQFSDGDKFVGTFQNNSFYKGRYIQGSDGSYFEGTFKDNLPDKGQWYDKNGNKTK